MSAYFETFKLGKTYKTPKGDAVIVKNFNLKMKKGEFVCVIGHSGCGKSTVLSMVAGLNEITEGGVILMAMKFLERHLIEELFFSLRVFYRG